MKRTIGIICFIFVAVLFFCGGAQSQPISGTYDTKNTDFAAGKWTEILYEGDEGKPGNEIRSGATEYYLFKDAILNDVILLGMPAQDQPFYEYRTVYKGGTLTLYNNPDAGWYNSMDEEGAPYVINLENTIVVTKKYVDLDGKPTGEIEFSLFVVDARFKDYQGYSACVTARFDKGQVERSLIPKPDSEPQDFTPAFGGKLSWAIISIKGPDYVEVPVDIKPGSCPNPVNIASKGVLPVAILGTRAIMPRDSLRVARGSVEIRIGRPIPTEGLRSRDRDTLLSRAREAMLGLLEEPTAKEGE